MKTFQEYLEESTKFSGSVYHGSGTRFSEFDVRKARIPNDFYGGGIAYFTDNLKVGIQYAKSMSKKTGTPFVYTCKISLRKMFDVNDVFTGKDLIGILPSDIESFARGAGLLGYDADKFVVLAQLKAGKLSLSGENVFRGLSSGMNQTAKAREFLITKGYDGLRYNGGVNMDAAIKHSVYLVYDPKNIKIEKRQKLSTK